MENPFLKFATKTKKVKIKALGDFEVEVREPTVMEVAEFYKNITDESGNVSATKFFEAKVARVVACMTQPKMSVEELMTLGAEAGDAINEVYEAIEALVKKPEGN